jgi:hypothetical protein
LQGSRHDRNAGIIKVVNDDSAARAAELLGLVAEDDRLRVVAALVLGAGSLADIATAAQIDVRRAGRALSRLETGGVVSSEESTWRLHPEVLREAARAAAPERPIEDHGAADPSDAAVLRRFIRDGRLLSIPVSQGRRRVVLDHIVRVFEPGVRYPEAEVNVLLRAFHPDSASLRRYLVDEGMLTREAGVYWRIGGTVDLD